VTYKIVRRGERLAVPVATGHPDTVPVAAEQRERFTGLSTKLTGFDELDLEATGVLDLYLGWLAHRFADVLSDLLDRLGDLNVALTDPKLGPFARAILQLWYTATWPGMSADWCTAYGYDPDALRVFGAAYPEGLMWRAAGLHPQGAKPTGFASWAQHP
jgi:hypothetical protein